MKPALLLVSIAVAAAAQPLPAPHRFPSRISVTTYGAKGDLLTDDFGAIQAALDAACSAAAGSPEIYFPPGTYAIAGELHARCPLSLTGDGPDRSVLYETDQANRRRALTTDFSLSIQDLGFRTRPLVFTSKDVTAIARGFGKPEAGGQKFTFRRVHIYGFNFGIIVSGGIGAEADSVTIDDCTIQVFTARNAVSTPINLANLRHATVENSTLIGDHNNDHAIYLLSVREASITENTIRDIGNSAIKLLTANYGKGAVCPATHDDYQSWRIEDNRIEDSVIAIAVYSYCDIVLPEVSIVRNSIRNMTDHYAGSYATVIVQAACQSVMKRVYSSANEFENIGMGGIVLFSTLQQPADGCADPKSNGTIRSFESNGDVFYNYSTAYPGTYPAINASGTNFGQASIERMRVNANLNGGPAYRLKPFANVTTDQIVEFNTPAGRSPSEPAQ